MGRPKGSVNKPVDKSGDTVENVINLPKVHYDCVMGIRVLRSGPFKGLWELVLLDDHMKRRQVLTDANSKGMLINIMNRQVSKIVIAM